MEARIIIYIHVVAGVRVTTHIRGFLEIHFNLRDEIKENNMALSFEFVLFTDIFLFQVTKVLTLLSFHPKARFSPYFFILFVIVFICCFYYMYLGPIYLFCCNFNQFYLSY